MQALSLAPMIYSDKFGGTLVEPYQRGLMQVLSLAPIIYTGKFGGIPSTGS